MSWLHRRQKHYVYLVLAGNIAASFYEDGKLVYEGKTMGTVKHNFPVDGDFGFVDPREECLRLTDLTFLQVKDVALSYRAKFSGETMEEVRKQMDDWTEKYIEFFSGGIMDVVNITYGNPFVAKDEGVEIPNE